MDNRACGIIIGVGGLLAGLFAARIAEWPTLSAAGLAVLVCIAVSLLLLVLLPARAR